MKYVKSNQFQLVQLEVNSYAKYNFKLDLGYLSQFSIKHYLWLVEKPSIDNTALVASVIRVFFEMGNVIIENAKFL